MAARNAHASEVERLRAVYRQRGTGDGDCHIDAYNVQDRQEIERAIASNLRRTLGGRSLRDLSCVEVGCGSGGNLLLLLALGFPARNLSGIELMPDRAADAIRRLPAAVPILVEDACQTEIAPASRDLVLAFTVFSSILEPKVQERLADRMWGWVKPKGAVVWYDFVYNNPRNPHVRGVPVSRVRQLFPRAKVTAERVTIVPPIGRFISRHLPFAPGLLSILPLPRSHVLCWLEKTGGSARAIRMDL